MKNPREWFTDLLYRPKIQLYESRMNELQRSNAAARADYEGIKREYEQYLKDEMKLGKADWRRNSILSALYYRGITKKEEIYKVVRNYKENYLYTAILQLLVEDALSHDPITNEIVQITSDNKEIKADLDELQERISIDDMVASIVEDMLSYGEYFMNVVSEDETGVSEVNDDAQQNQMLAVYDGILPKYFLRREKSPGTSSVQLKEVHPSKMLHFCYGYSKIRIEIDSVQQKEYMRMGRPVLWGTFNLLNYLDTLTALVPALYVQKLNSTSIIGVKVPDGTDPKDALEAAQRYESILNRFTVGEENEQIVSQILAAAGRFKCVPVWGDKGQLEDMDPRWKNEIQPQLFEELRKSIMASVGIPYNFIFGGGGDKQETLKQFSRYVRKLAMIQKAIKNGLLQLALIHLVSKNPERLINIQDIQIKFTNQLLSIEDLDKLEFVDTLVAVVQKVVESIKAIGNQVGAAINVEEIAAFLQRYLRTVNLENLYVFSKEPLISPVQPGQEVPISTEPMKQNYDRDPSVDPKTRAHLQSFIEAHVKRLAKKNGEKNETS